MESQLVSNLLRLPALGSASATHGAVTCKVCAGKALQFDIVDFNKICAADYYTYGFSGIPVLYYRCQNCSLIFTDFFDDWTNDDFAKFIYNPDYLLIDGEYIAIRPRQMADEMARFLADHRSAHILDYGSGNGAFAERLKAHGFTTVENYDPFSSPRRPLGEFDIVTCFETIEHSPFPKDTMADLLSFMKPEGCIILSTGIQPPNINEIRGNWWYIGPRNGHVSIYSLVALYLLGARFGVGFYAGHGKLAFAGPVLSPRLAPLLQSIGTETMFARLTAPGDHSAPVEPETEPLGSGIGWHAIEVSGSTRFRWTSTDRIEWIMRERPTNYPCTLTITIPVLMEIMPGFADKCVVEIASRAYPVRREERSITVTAQLDQLLQQPIALVTPQPQRPSDLLGVADDRPLGLAIPI
jgi:SAM-dependent methyltransferase